MWEENQWKFIIWSLFLFNFTGAWDFMLCFALNTRLLGLVQGHQGSTRKSLVFIPERGSEFFLLEFPDCPLIGKTHFCHRGLSYFYSQEFLSRDAYPNLSSMGKKAGLPLLWGTVSKQEYLSIYSLRKQCWYKMEMETCEMDFSGS